MGVGEPKGAGEKRAFDRLPFLRNLAGIVPQHKSVAHHIFLDRLDRTANAGVGRRQEAYRGQQQDAGVEQLRSVGFDKRVLLAIKTLVANFATDGIAQCPPSVERRIKSELFSALDAAIERHPGHHLRRDVMPALAAPLPDAVVRLVPYLS